MRHATLAVLALPILLAAGCAEGLRADRPATTDDLELTVEGIGLQPEGGLPAQVRVTVRNRSEAVVALTLPRPLAAPDETSVPAEMPLPVLGLMLRDAEGHEESPVYTEPEAKAWPKPKTGVLAPGGTWSATYAIGQFYFWGPCGPDTGGSFAKYFWRGEQEVTLAAMLFFGEGEVLESAPIPLRCRFEDWLFRKTR